MVSNFDKLANRLASQPGVTDPKALAASIGRKKFGSAVMAKASAQRRPAAAMKRGMSDNDADDRRMKRGMSDNDADDRR